MRFRLTVLVLALALSAGCSQARGGGPTLGPVTDGTTSTTSTTAAPTPTTTTTTTTTTPSRWPVLADGPARVVVTPTGVVAPVRGAHPDGWRVTTPCGKEAVVTSGRPIHAAHVVIDPGHGGREVGAVADNGMLESEVNAAVAAALARALEAQGMTAVLTREADYRLPIVTRAEIVEALQPNLFISIHHNGGVAPVRADPGTEVYFQKESPESRRLAGLLWEDLYSTLAAYPVQWRGGRDAGAIYRLDRGGDDFYGVLRRTAGTPSVLVEVAYPSNPQEAELLSRSDVRTALAGAMARAIGRYFLTDEPGSGFQTPLFRGYGSSGGGTLVNCSDPALR
jgi:N-acetylmuramoyl-L-alanine amidase